MCNCVDGEADIERWEIAGQWKSRVCPRRFVTDDSVAWFQLWNHYRDGHLAFAGGVLDQPALFMDAMRFISATWKQANEK